MIDVHRRYIILDCINYHFQFIHSLKSKHYSTDRDPPLGPICSDDEVDGMLLLEPRYGCNLPFLYSFDTLLYMLQLYIPNQFGLLLSNIFTQSFTFTPRLASRHPSEIDKGFDTE